MKNSKVVVVDTELLSRFGIDFFVFLFFCNQARDVDVFCYTKHVVCLCVFLCSGLISCFYAINSVFLCACLPGCGGGWHVEIVVCLCVFLCSGLISCFYAINSLFLCACLWVWLGGGMRKSSYVSVCFCVVGFMFLCD